MQDSSDKNLNKNDALLQRIKTILDRTAPSAWIQGGELLNPNITHQKPRQTWELVYLTKIASGTLVVRCSVPLNSVFLGKGFQYQPSARPLFFVELRSLNWRHEELTDPFRRIEQSDRKREVLAEGQLAQQIFGLVKETYDSFQRENSAQFKTFCQNLLSEMHKALKDERDAYGVWDKYENDPEVEAYINNIKGCDVIVNRLHKNGRNIFYIDFQQDALKCRITENGIAEELFTLVLENEQSTKLETLSKVLEQV